MTFDDLLALARAGARIDVHCGRAVWDRLRAGIPAAPPSLFLGGLPFADGVRLFVSDSIPPNEARAFPRAT